MADDIKTPHHVDIYVGGRVRTARKTRGVSQESLAEALGLTFQQIQKYERGTNRISASKMYETAQFLGLPIDYFYPPLEASDGLVGGLSHELETAVAEIGQAMVLQMAALPRADRRVIGDLIARFEEIEAREGA